jgi:hypothetical protein
MTTDEELRRREWRIRRVLTLEELIRLNRRVDEFSEGRRPPAPQLDIRLDPKALIGVLRLVMRDALRQSDYQQYGRPEELATARHSPTMKLCISFVRSCWSMTSI